MRKDQKLIMIDKTYYPIGIYPWIFMVIYYIFQSAVLHTDIWQHNLFFILLIKADNVLSIYNSIKNIF